MSELGSCPRGDSCTFAHNVGELCPKSSSGFSSEPDRGVGFSSGYKRKQELPQNQYQSSENLQSSSGYKSVLCNKFSAFGRCPYGDACTFAHGEAELTQNKRMKF